VIVHTQRESFPFQGTALAVHLICLLSVLFGAGSVSLTYRIALEMFPHQRRLALGAAAINAFIPQFLFISGAVNNDSLVILLSSLALLLIIRLLHNVSMTKSQFPIGHWSLLGFVLGLACLSKLIGHGLLILTAIILIIEACRRRSPRPLVGRMITPTVALAVGGWWYIRNWTLYGDPTGLNMMLAVVGRGSPPSNLPGLWGEFRGLRMSFWAPFGWFSILVAPAAYVILDAVSLLALAGLAVWFVRQRKKRSGGFALRSLSVLILWLAIVFLGLVRWTWITPGTRGRLLFPAISAISILLMVGLSQFVPARYAKNSVGVISLAMLVFAVLCPFLYMGPAYVRPPIFSPDEILPGVVQLNADFGYALSPSKGGKIRLLGYQLDRERVKPGETLGITLYWQGLVEMKENYYLFIHLLGRRGLLVGYEDTYHGWGSYPTSLWRPGEIIGDTYRLPISEDALAPSLIRVDVGLYDPSTGRGLTVFDQARQPIGNSVIIGQLKMVPRGRREYAIDNQLYFNLANKVALTGYNVDKADLRSGEEIRLTLYRQAEEEMGTDYTVFTHLIDKEGKILGADG